KLREPGPEFPPLQSTWNRDLRKRETNAAQLRGRNDDKEKDSAPRAQLRETCSDSLQGHLRFCERLREALRKLRCDCMLKEPTSLREFRGNAVPTPLARPVHS